MDIKIIKMFDKVISLYAAQYNNGDDKDFHFYTVPVLVETSDKQYGVILIESNSSLFNYGDIAAYTTAFTNVTFEYVQKNNAVSIEYVRNSSSLIYQDKLYALVKLKHINVHARCLYYGYIKMFSNKHDAQKRYLQILLTQQEE
jgi:hypothetical protein